ncbi:MAG: ferritin-like domain-containing protein, partial [Actinomycetota bacterium]|nr:ferritin-like domain-containing protein [Actinomycetota bacterium]
PALGSLAQTRVLVRSGALRDECYAAAGRARSGKFARLVASMGAALSQRLATAKANPGGVTSILSSTADTTWIGALQATLAGEHAAVYVFGLLAAQTSRSVQPRQWADLDAAYVWHRDARDELVSRVTADAHTPVAASPSYRLPNDVGNSQRVVRAALVTEQRVTDTYGTLVAETASGVRRWGIRSLDQSAVRQLRFQGRPEILPGTGLAGQLR